MSGKINIKYRTVCHTKKKYIAYCLKKPLNKDKFETLRNLKYIYIYCFCNILDCLLILKYL